MRMESKALVYLTIPKYNLKTKKDIVVAEIQKKYNNAVSCVRKRRKSKLLLNAYVQMNMNVAIAISMAKIIHRGTILMWLTAFRIFIVYTSK